MIEVILEILKFTIPALAVCLVTYIILSKQADKEERLRILDIKSKTGSEMLPLKMQAYERITLLLHRIAPETMIPRTQQVGLNVGQLKKILVNTVKSEYEHNITQQVYVSSTVWKATLTYVNDLINVINVQAEALNDESAGYELSKAVLQYYVDHPDTINSQRVLEVVKQEVKTLYI
jgi:hypothetical protein